MPPSPSSGPPWLSESLSPTSPWGMPFEGADACGGGGGGGAGLGAGLGLGAGSGTGWGAAATCGCLLVAGGVEAFELPLSLPPQAATPTAMRKVAAAAARKVLSLLRTMGCSSVGDWDQRGSLPPRPLSSAGGRQSGLLLGRYFQQPNGTREVV